MATKVKTKGKLKTYLQMPLLLGIALALINVVVYMLNTDAGILLTVFVVIYLATIILMMIFSGPALEAELIGFATEYGQIQKQLLKELELPHALLDENGRVIWMNRAFEAMGSHDKFYKKSISNIIPELTKDKFPTDEGNVEHDVIIGDRDFQARMKRISLQDMALLADMKDGRDYDGYLIAVYLFDRTALKMALKEIDDQSLAVGLAYIDNYEETIENIQDPEKRSMLAVYTDTAIQKSFTALDGIVRKTEKDKYLVIFRKSALKILENERFQVLEDVKKTSGNTASPVTLSIGMGVDGLTYAQNCEFARNAIDLALGRGGDQAIVKNRKGISYYGGKSQQKESMTRVKARVKAQAMEEIISARDKVFVMGHRNGDADSFGSTVGIKCACVNLKKECHIVLDSVTPSLQPLVDLYKNDPGYEEGTIVTGQKAIDMAGDNAVLVVVDVNKPSITECPELLKKCSSIIVLDHHRQGTESIENATLAYIEPYASSACEMVAEILQYIHDGVKFKGVVADCLYSGLVMDTQNFTAKTGVRTFEAAAYLRRGGADVTLVRKLFRDDPVDYRAKAEANGKVEVYKKYYAISTCPSDGIKSPTVVAAQSANELLNISGIKASFVMTDYQDKIYISARSIDEVNVQLIMERLGGGGHMTIAGAQLENMTMDDAVAEVKKTLDIMIQEGSI
ncbi:MAG: DHH family phosphoesterase [Lachnospiraceae bacterium]|nr:DHH family phosphoesterase [Lachnospiraceae bacterium]